MKNNNTLTVPKEKLHDFILENYEELTIAEIAEKSGHGWNVVGAICKKHNIVPITTGERNSNLVKKYSHLSISEICEVTGLEKVAVRRHLVNLGLPLSTEARVADKERVTSSLKDKGKTIKNLEEVKVDPRAYLGPIARKYMQTEPIEIVNRFLYGKQ